MMRGLGRAAFFLAIAVVTLLFIHIYRQNLIPVIEFKERTLDAGIVHDSNTLLERKIHFPEYRHAIPQNPEGEGMLWEQCARLYPKRRSAWRIGVH